MPRYGKLKRKMKKIIRLGSKVFLGKVKREKTITVKGKVLVYSPTDHGYVDPEDHFGMDGFGGSRTVWRFPKRIRKRVQYKRKK
jgi:hypothetical protein